MAHYVSEFHGSHVTHVAVNVLIKKIVVYTEQDFKYEDFCKQFALSRWG